MLEWRENLSIGVDSVDNQHKEIFKKLNNLFNACTEGRGQDEVTALVRFLENYVMEHFWDEEKLQRESNYPDYEAHRDEHQKFVQDIENFKQRIKSENPGTQVLEAYTLVSQWLMTHICESDRAFGVYYRERLKEKQDTKI